MAHSQYLSDAIQQRITDAQRHAQASPFNGKPPVEVLDVSSGWDSMAKFDVVIRRLKQLKLYDKKDLLFCPARWKEIKQLGFTKEGPDDRHVQCETEAYIRNQRDGRNLPREMCEFTHPALIVFKSYALEGSDCRYYPLGDLRVATVIIFLLTSDDF